MSSVQIEASEIIGKTTIAESATTKESNKAIALERVIFTINKTDKNFI